MRLDRERGKRAWGVASGTLVVYLTCIACARLCGQYPAIRAIAHPRMHCCPLGAWLVLVGLWQVESKTALLSCSGHCGGDAKPVLM